MLASSSGWRLIVSSYKESHDRVVMQRASSLGKKHRSVRIGVIETACCRILSADSWWSVS